MPLGEGVYIKICDPLFPIFCTKNLMFEANHSVATPEHCAEHHDIESHHSVPGVGQRPGGLPTKYTRLILVDGFNSLEKSKVRKQNI